MTDFELRIREALRSEVSDIQARPFVGVRRARTGQLVNAIAAATVVGVIVFGVVAILDDPSDIGRVSVGAVEDARASGGTAPCDYPERLPKLRGECVATGAYEGTSWWVGAYTKDDQVCMSETRTNAGASSGCWEHDPEAIRLGVSSTSASEVIVGHGLVHANVGQLVLTRTDGDPIDVELYPAPDGLPFDARFFHVFLPLDVKDLVAYTADGAEVARQPVGPIDNYFGALHARPITPRTRIAEGNFAGHPWTFSAYEERTDGNVVPCVELFYGKGESLGGGGGCEIGVPHDRKLGMSQVTFEGHRSLAVAGAVHPDATDVKVELGSGEVYDATLVRPEQFESGVGFYVVWFEAPSVKGPEGAVVAYDSSGSEIARHELCARMLDGGTCGP